MSIRWREADEKEVDRVVKNFNAKVARIELQSDGNRMKVKVYVKRDPYEDVSMLMEEHCLSADLVSKISGVPRSVVRDIERERKVHPEYVAKIVALRILEHLGYCDGAKR